MSENPEVTFGKIYDVPDDLIQLALDADAAREEPGRRPHATQPTAGRNGPVETIAKADPRVLEAAQLAMQGMDVHLETQRDGSIRIVNNRP